MKRVLVLGGYGGFGRGVSEGLLERGFEVVVAGRGLGEAERFCAGRPGLVPAAVDRDRDLAEALSWHSPWAVVDAAGPFQGLDYRVPQACIAVGAHYLDLADAREFVAGIGALDAAARVAGVAVISGASSVPALSGAVVRRLAESLDRVTAVEMSISASNRASFGRSVMQAVLSGAGRPLRLWRSGHWTGVFGLSEARKERYALDGGPPVGPRIVSLVDVPDLDLLAERLPGRPAVVFRAGTELATGNLALTAIGLLRRAGLLRKPQALAPWLAPIVRATAWLGSDRSAMAVTVHGLAGERRLMRRWTLIAERGDGPKIPTLAAPLLAQALAEGRLELGAGDAGQLLSLEVFEGAFAPLAVRHGEVEHEPPPPLYSRVLGERFQALAPTLRRMHAPLRDGGAAGMSWVERGRQPLARLVAALFRFPRAGEAVPVHVSFSEGPDGEVWTRDFDGRQFSSRLSQRGDLLVERFGALRFGFRLPARDGGLEMVMARWWLGPVPLPLALAPKSLAREWEAEGRFHFDVPISLPLVGLVVRYTGWLDPL